MPKEALMEAQLNIDPLFDFRVEKVNGEVVVVVDMTDEERKIYRILLDRIRRMAEDKSQSPVNPSVDSVTFLGMAFSGSEWKRFKIDWEAHVCDNLGARLTSVRKDSSNFYVANPSESNSWKPHSYFEIGRDVGLKILALGYTP